MHTLLDEITVIPGVAGACIFDKTRGVTNKKFMVKLPRDITDNVGMNFIRLLQMAGMNRLEISSMQFRFDRYWLICIPLTQGVILLAICDLQANSSLVASTALMLAEDLRRRIEKPSGGRTDAGRRPGDFAEGASDFRRYYSEIESALTAAIGPVARMVMSECVYKWRHGGAESVDRLPELMDILAEEIEDPDLVTDFKTRLQHLF